MIQYPTDTLAILDPLLSGMETYFFILQSKVKAINEDILLKAERRRKLLTTIGLRQLQFVDHVMRKKEMEELFVTGRIEGKRDRGRQRLT